MTAALNPGRPFTGSERQLLENTLDLNRSELVRAVENLSDTEAREKQVPSLTTPISLIKHCATAERIWFQRTLAGMSIEACDGHATGGDGSFHVADDETLAGVIAEYEAACQRSNELAATRHLDDTVEHHLVGTVSLRFSTSAEGGYSMQVGDADAGRLKLLGRFYDPHSAAFLEAAGVAAGDSVADLGCGHGAVTDRIAARVGDTGTVYAVDASPDQLRIARAALAHRRNVTFVEAAVEDHPLAGVRVDWVYSRFLLMHVSDVRRALLAMANMLTEGGALLLEVADVGSLRFLPESPDSDVWRPWWYALGRARGAAYDVAERIEGFLDQAGFTIERCDRYQPVAASAEAKLVHALGFDQCAPAYLNEIGAPADQIDAHYSFLRRAVDDPTIMVALFNNTQYIARRR